MSARLIGLAGIVAIFALALLLSRDRKAINLRVVGAAFALQVAVAALILYVPAGAQAIDWLSDGVLKLVGYSRAGIDMVFGPLGDQKTLGFVFAVHVLPVYPLQ